MLRVLINPISVVSLLLLGWCVVLLRNRHWKPLARVAFLLISLSLPALPFVAKACILSIEKTYPSRPNAEYPNADAIVILGGTGSRVTKLRREPGEVFGNRLLRGA